MAQLSPEQILAAIEAAEESASEDLEIASDRADALDRFLGKPYGDEQVGRSQVVSRDISDVVEGVAANVLKPFIGGDRVVVFNPRGPEDEKGAQQETDYINFVVMERNNGFVALNSSIKDALLLRNGYLKCGWAKRDDITTEDYVGLSDEELALLAQDEDVEIVGHSEYPLAGMMQPQIIGQESGQGMAPDMQQQMPMAHDVKVHRKQPTEYVEVMPMPPQEIKVSKRSTQPSVQNADFVQHRTHKTLSELRELGYKVADDIVDDEDASGTMEDQARSLLGTEGDLWSDPTGNAARRLVLFKESWIRLDANGDGIAELRRVCSVGKNLLADEEADLIPIACFTPVLMPHRHQGVSVYDLVKDIAQIKTAMLRSHLDNRYLQNNAEKVVNVNAVENIDDFLVSRPGGLKRVTGSPGEAVMPLVVPDTGAGALMTLEYLDAIRENRTGYTKTAEGMKSGSLATNTATEYMNQISQSGIRLEMIARTIAETGLRDLFRIVHALTLKHSSRAEKIRLRNEWTVINPREWVRRTDLSISVGLGSTTGPQQMQNLMMIGQAQTQAMPLGIVTPENVYNTLSKLATAAGFKNPDEFFTRPKGPPPERKDPLVEAEQVKAQASLQGKQMELQAKPQEMQLEIQKAVEEGKVKVAIARENAQIEAQTKLQVAQIEVAAKERIELSKHRTDALVATGVDYHGMDQDREVRAKSENAVVEAIKELVANMAKPRKRKVIRGKNGTVEGMIEE